MFRKLRKQRNKKETRKYLPKTQYFLVFCGKNKMRNREKNLMKRSLWGAFVICLIVCMHFTIFGAREIQAATQKVKLTDNSGRYITIKANSSGNIYHLYDKEKHHLTGIQYLNFIADVFGIDATTREERIKKYADEFEITSALGDMISSYSHGMKQKVAIIGALIHEPKLLVLDEPFVGLDPKAALSLKNIMHEMCENGSAVFFSTHVLEVAQKLCNKISIIKQGQIL